MAFKFAVAPTVIVRWLNAHRMRLLALFGCVLAPLFLFGELAEDILEKEPLAFDAAILLFMHSHATPTLDRTMLLASTLGAGAWVAPVDVLVCAVLLGRRRWLDALFWALATGGASLLNMLAKHTFARTRPDLWVSLAPESSFSFPSAHAMQSMALAAALIVLLWSTRARWPVVILAVAFTLMVGTSRVYLGVHFPSDVLAGWSASLAWVTGLSFLFYRHAVRRGSPRAVSDTVLRSR